MYNYSYIEGVASSFWKCFQGKVSDTTEVSAKSSLIPGCFVDGKNNCLQQLY